MHGLGQAAEQPGGERRAGIEWGVDEGSGDAGIVVLGAGGTRDAPKARLEGDGRRGGKGLDLAGRSGAQRDRALAAVARDDVVEDGGVAAGEGGTRPVPAAEAGFEGLVAVVAVEITGA